MSRPSSRDRFLRCVLVHPLALAASLLAAASAQAQSPAQGAGSTAPVLKGDSWAAIAHSGSGTVTVAYFYPLEGFAYRDASGKLTGLLIDIVEQFRSYLKNVKGADVTYRYVPYEDFGRFYADVRHSRGGVLGLAGTTITEARKKEVGFGPPFFASRPVLITNPSVPDLTSKERIPVELQGFTALAFRGTTLEARLHRLQAERFPGLVIESLGTIQEITARISRDRRTFAYLDLNSYWSERKRGMAVKRHPAADEAREDFGFIMPLGSDWQAPLAEFFAAGGGYRHSRTYRQLMIKHLGVDLEELLETGD